MVEDDRSPVGLDAVALLHELQVHQVELEMQNAELRETQAELESERARYVELYDQAPVGYCTVDAIGVILEANRMAGGLFGCAAASLVGRRIAQLLAPGDRAAYGEHHQRLFQTAEPQDMEVQLDRALGGPSWVHLEMCVGQDDARGIAVGRMTLRDVTALRRSEAERAQLERTLAHAQKLESVGRLAGGVAHDFNNMLAVILAQAELSLAEAPPDGRLHTSLSEIRDAALRSAALTRQLLAFARRETVQPRVLNLNTALEPVTGLMRSLLGEDVRLVYTLAPDLWNVRIDPSQIDQIAANLCVNARDAMPNGGVLRVSTYNRTLDPESCLGHPNRRPGDFVCLEVADDGCGMDAETMTQIFEPFFTTKPLGKGTGLGLSTVYGAILQNRGFIEVESTPGVGSTFRLHLPRHSLAPAPTPVERTAATELADERKRVVLVVEDEPTILRVVTRMLVRLGYAVVSANSGPEALTLAAEHSGPIDILLTDVVLPDMNGRELGHHLRKLMPALLQVYMSGYTADIIADHGVLDGAVHFLQKPFTLAALEVKLQEVLAAASGGAKPQGASR